MSSSSASSGIKTGLPGTRVTGSSSESSEIVMSSLLRPRGPTQTDSTCGEGNEKRQTEYDAALMLRYCVIC